MIVVMMMMMMMMMMMWWSCWMRACKRSYCRDRKVSILVVVGMVVVNAVPFLLPVCDWHWSLAISEQAEESRTTPLPRSFMCLGKAYQRTSNRSMTGSRIPTLSSAMILAGDKSGDPSVLDTTFMESPGHLHHETDSRRSQMMHPEVSSRFFFDNSIPTVERKTVVIRMERQLGKWLGRWRAALVAYSHHWSFFSVLDAPATNL